MDKKVYCRNCKWYQDKVIKNINLFTSEVGWFCFHPKNCKDSFSSPNSITIKYPGELNKNNKCKYYKRKWWIFWIR